MSGSYNGTVDGLDLGDALNLFNGLAATTITGWLQREADLLDNEQIIFFEENAGLNSRIELQVFNIDNLLGVNARAPDIGVGQTGKTAAVIPVDTTSPAPPIFFAAVVNVAGDTIDMYLDGVLSLSTAVAFANAAFDATVTGDDNSLAMQLTGGVALQWWPGKLADIRIYDRALSANEIKTMWLMRGHDGLRGPRRSLQFRFTTSDLNGGVALTTTNVRDSSAAQIVPNPTVINGAPVFRDDLLAYRQVVSS